MPEATRDSEVWKGMRRGMGWAFGVGTVVTVASVLRDGGRATIKSAMIASMHGQTRIAEFSEQMQDLYAEAMHERLGQDSPARDA
jgi:hypothetical protein